MNPTRRVPPPSTRMPGTLVVLVTLLLVAGCSKNTTGPSGGGTVTGRVTAADGRTAIARATVAVASTNAPSTLTDGSGSYTLSGVPSGTQSLRARRGNFERTFLVDVREGETVTAPVAALQPSGKLAYVPGFFDSIERVVRDQLGNPMDQLSASQLGSAGTLSQYRMIFLNCGLDTAPVFLGSSGASTLLAWVRGGGVLYASDFALEYIVRMLPSDNIRYDGGRAETITASVTDAGLQAFIGRSSVQIRYDLSGWYSPTSLPSRARVLLRGTHQTSTGAAERPLAFVIDEGAGRIVYTSFHNESGVTTDQIDVLRYYIYIE